MGRQSFCFWPEIVVQTNQSAPHTFQRMVIWYSAATMSVGKWKNFSFIMPLSSGGFLLIHLRLVWRQFYWVMDIRTLQYLLLMQFTWKKPLPTFKVCWKKKIVKTTSGTYVLTWRSWQCWLGCKEVVQNIVASFVNGIALLWKAMATPRRNDSRSEECSTSSFSRQDENIFTSTSLKTWIN